MWLNGRPALDQVENDFSRGRRAYIDDHQITVAGIAKVMIDVDPDFCGTNRSERSSEPILNCCVERDGDIDVDGRRRRFGQQFGARQERIFFEHAVFIPDQNVLAELLK